MLSNLKIGIRLAIGFLMVLLFLIAISSFSLFNINELGFKIDSLVTSELPKLTYSKNIVIEINQGARYIRNAYIYTGEEAKKSIENVPKSRKIVGENFGKLEKILSTNAEIENFKKLKEARNAYIVEVDKYLSFLKAGQREDAVNLLSGELRKAQEAFLKLADGFAEEQTLLTIKIGNATESFSHESERILLALTAIATLLSVAVAWFITRSITTPARSLMENANKMALGNFSTTIKINQKDEIGALAQSLCAMQAAQSRP